MAAKRGKVVDDRIDLKYIDVAYTRTINHLKDIQKHAVDKNKVKNMMKKLTTQQVRLARFCPQQFFVFFQLKK